MKARILHNPACSTSRAVLDMVRAAGIEPEIVAYLETPPTREDMVAMLVAMEASPRDILRAREPLAAELGLLDPALHDRDLLDALLENPRLIERPIVITEKGVRLCRPKERVLDIL
ncbi:arsenate reductase (glutaredoxin) [Shinella pollutisoli]|uniref:Arsenate reductase n=1 Tax=Shinella pollutisoli TaxID=2250594 RepID=A0ABV7DD79_9HYPH|nr:arsenate reductase (glutaredoxin) [Shinella pollutisoli]